MIISFILNSALGRYILQVLKCGLVVFCFNFLNTSIVISSLTHELLKTYLKCMIERAFRGLPFIVAF